jgi:hypothetical protein
MPWPMNLGKQGITITNWYFHIRAVRLCIHVLRPHGDWLEVNRIEEIIFCVHGCAQCI